MRAVLLSVPLVLSAQAALACAQWQVGDLTIEHAWTRATIGAARPAVFYVEITNAGAADDALVGLSTPAAGMPMLHETVVTDGIASMPHTPAIAVPAGQKVTLAPGGYHGMLMELAAALKDNDSFPMTLTFEKAGTVTVDVEVTALNGKGPDCETGDN